MKGRIDEIGASTGGKLKAKIGGKWYFMPAGAVVEKGWEIEFDPGTFDFNGKTFDKINSWGRLPQTESQSGHDHAQNELSEPDLRFISNCVGSAITAGTIKEPSQISAWAKAAHEALQAVRTFGAL